MIRGTTITFQLLNPVIKDISQTGRFQQKNKQIYTTTKTVMVLKTNTNIPQLRT